MLVFGLFAKKIDSLLCFPTIIIRLTLSDILNDTKEEQITCRCPWLNTSKEDYVKYHDEEWAVPRLAHFNP